MLFLIPLLLLAPPTGNSGALGAKLHGDELKNADTTDVTGDHLAGDQAHLSLISVKESMSDLLQDELRDVPILPRMYVFKYVPDMEVRYFFIGSLIANVVLVASLVLCGKGGKAADETDAEDLANFAKEELASLEELRGKVEAEKEECHKKILAATAQLHKLEESNPAPDRLHVDPTHAAIEAVKAANLLTEARPQAVLKVMAPVLRIAGNTMTQSLSKRAKSVGEKAESLLNEEAARVSKEIDAVFEGHDAKGHQAAMSSNLYIPPLPILLAALWAKSRLIAKHASNELSVFTNTMYAVLGIFAFATNWASPCHADAPSEMDEFMAFVVADTSLCVLGACLALLQGKHSGELLAALESAPDLPAHHESPLRGIEKLIFYAATMGTSNLVQLERFKASWLSAILSVVGAVQFLNFSFGIKLVFATSWYECEGYGHWALFVLRWRAVLYLALFVPRLLILMDTLANRIIGEKGWAQILLGVAHAIDNFLQIGFPIATIYVKGVYADRQAIVELEINFCRHIKEEVEEKKPERRGAAPGHH